MKNPYKVLFRTLIKSLKRPRLRWADNINIYVKQDTNSWTIFICVRKGSGSGPLWSMLRIFEFFIRWKILVPVWLSISLECPYSVELVLSSILMTTRTYCSTLLFSAHASRATILIVLIGVLCSSYDIYVSPIKLILLACTRSRCLLFTSSP